MTMRHIPLNNRREFGNLCNEMGLTSAVEIGTHQGVFADQFMRNYAGCLLCIDPWEGSPPDKNEIWYPNFDPASPSREYDMKLAQFVLHNKYDPDRTWFLRSTSIKAAVLLRNYPKEFGEWMKRHGVESDNNHRPRFGMVYIDGVHTVPHAKADIAAWWEFVDDGGIFAGHDYDMNDPTLRGVAIAVNAFVERQGLDLYTTQGIGDDTPPSWYVFKR